MDSAEKNLFEDEKLVIISSTSAEVEFLEIVSSRPIKHCDIFVRLQRCSLLEFYVKSIVVLKQVGHQDLVRFNGHWSAEVGLVVGNDPLLLLVQQLQVVDGVGVLHLELVLVI